MFPSIAPYLCTHLPSLVVLSFLASPGKAVDRGNQLDDIEQKSDVLLVDANKFQESAAATKRMFCRRHWRNIIIAAIVAAVRPRALATTDSCVRIAMQ
jgi:hypothetical protein